VSKAHISPQIAAQRLGVTAHTIRNWIRNGRLRAVDIGTELRPLYRIPAAAIDELLTPGRVTGKAN